MFWFNVHSYTWTMLHLFLNLWSDAVTILFTGIQYVAVSSVSKQLLSRAHLFV